MQLCFRDLAKGLATQVPLDLAGWDHVDLERALRLTSAGMQSSASAQATQL
jgi:hypothetical protein